LHIGPDDEHQLISTIHSLSPESKVVTPSETLCLAEDPCARRWNCRIFCCEQLARLAQPLICSAS